MKKISFLLLLIVFNTSAADSLQVVRGKITSAASQSPIYNATITISGKHLYTVLSDSLGNYSSEVSPGKYYILIEHPAFRSTGRSNILVVSAKQQVQNFELTEYKNTLATVTVQPNEEENIHADNWNIQQFAAVFYDPARVINSHAGIVNTNDQANNFSVRGTSPNYVQWKMESVEVVNPNHLENAGTVNDRPTLNGGGVSMISAQLLNNSPFRFSPFEPISGNALSGSLDIKLRNGNNEKNEKIIQASFLGIDLSFEGPFSKKQTSSYLVNFRYSTIGLLNKLGVNFGDEKINYKDLSVVINVPYKRGSMKFFSITGNSENLFDGKKDTAEALVQKDLQNIAYRSFTSINGLSLVTTLSNSLFLKTIIAYSDKTVTRNSEPSTDLLLIVKRNEKLRQGKLSTLNYITKGIGDYSHLKTGTYINYFTSEINNSLNDSSTTSAQLFQPILQPFISYEVSPIKKVELIAGLHSLYLPQTNEFILLPRFLVKLFAEDKNSFSFNYGKNAQLQPFLLYLPKENRNLSPTTNHSFSFIHDFKTNAFSLKNEVYYQLYEKVPVQPENNFSGFNYFNEDVPFELHQNGEALVYGYDVTLKTYYRGFYFIASSGFYNSSFTIDGRSKNARFNTGSNYFVTTGKEQQLKNKKDNISIDLRGTYRNGFKETPATQDPYDYDYTLTLPEYFRIDLRLAYRRNKANSSVIWALDIQNVSNRKNVAFHYYDVFTRKVETQYQLGLIPVFSYKILF